MAMFHMVMEISANTKSIPEFRVKLEVNTKTKREVVKQLFGKHSVRQHGFNKSFNLIGGLDNTSLR